MLIRIDKYMEFNMGFRLFFTKLQVVDKHLVFEPVNSRNMPLIKTADIPFCHTEMGEHTKVLEGNKSFKMKQPFRGDNNNVGDDEELQDPEVYFAFLVSPLNGFFILKDLLPPETLMCSPISVLQNGISAAIIKIKYCLNL